MKLGIDPVHFGIIMVVNMEVGMCHPPVGLNLYVASGITKMGITELTVAVWPWLLSMLVFLGFVTYWPAMSIWLPKTLGMMGMTQQQDLLPLIWRAGATCARFFSFRRERTRVGKLIKLFVFFTNPLYFGV